VISDNFRQFHYFDRQLNCPDWRGKRILDFGGNCGNFLTQAKAAVAPEDYWCVDLSRDALDEGQRRHPTANWIFYDRFNLQYNPTGKPLLPVPAHLPTFDFIVAYSVFTHTTEHEMIDLVAQLRAHLAPAGRLIFTFIDPHFVPEAPFRHPEERHASLLQERDSNLLWRLNRRKDVNPQFAVEAPLARAAGCESCFLINDAFYLHGEPEPSPGQTGDPLHESFHTPQRIRTLFPGAEVLPPVNGERQHACVLGLGPSPL